MLGKTKKSPTIPTRIKDKTTKTQKQITHDCKLLDHLRDYLEKTKNDWNYITPHDFYHQYYITKKMRDIYLIDLRKPEEYRKMHIKGAHNIFWLDLLDDSNLRRLPKDKTIFLICYVGHTSSQAMVLLKLLGYKVVSIKFGYGISPVFELPVAGWTAMRYPTTKCK
jgi:rhodanese-related sulfurtransferase